jgi:hypothetical protein
MRPEFEGIKHCTDTAQGIFPFSGVGLLASTTRNLQRHEAAISYFKKAFCAMRAF